ncbi:putative SOS response-associated peptidase YedK [Paraburkholderia youngii]|uniref:SOS response-associated peptidase family protein n=1 Tax=Paraburkholderia youngii TaxID=2782701 RepID=UPI003D227CB0
MRWRIGTASGHPLAIVGFWRSWKEVDGSHNFSFTMLTVNSDEHPLMKRFQTPGAQKRSVVIVRPTQYGDWLSCRSSDEAHSFLNLYPVEAWRAEAYPLPPRKSPVTDGASDPQLPFVD